MTTKAYAIRDTEGANYYVLADTHDEIVDFVNDDLDLCGFDEHIRADSSSIKELDMNEIKLYDEDLGEHITIADGLKRWDKGIIFCSEW